MNMPKDYKDPPFQEPSLWETCDTVEKVVLLLAGIGICTIFLLVLWFLAVAGEGI